MILKLIWIVLVDSTWVFLLLSFYIVISWNIPLFKVWSEDKLTMKFVVAENFAKNSNARGLSGGGMLKLRFDWYIWNGLHKDKLAKMFVRKIHRKKALPLN